MKQYCSLFLCILCGVTLFSCQSDEPGPVDVYIDPKGSLWDGGEISGLNFYCIEKKSPILGEMSYDDYYRMTKTVGSYSDFYLQLEFKERGHDAPSADDAQIIIIQKDYEKRKSSFIVEEYEKYRYDNPLVAEWPILFTAYTNGVVSIACDKVLFGEEPGVNLDKYFNVNRYYGVHDMFVENAGSRCLPIGIENPRMLYNFGEEIPHEMDKYFVKGTWLQPKYYLQFKELPTEKYDDLTLTVTFPMIREHVWDYAVAKYRGENITAAKLTEVVFKADCQIKFEWE